MGVALAGLLGLTGIVLLTQARPIGAPAFHRSYSDGDFEAKEEVRGTPLVIGDDAPLPAARRAMARASAPPRFASSPVSPSPPRPLFRPPPTPPAREPVDAPADVAPAAPHALAMVLRAGGLACLGGREALLSSAERELCRERLGAQAWRAPSLSAIDPEERAGYDALARAQAPRRALVPLTARGAGGSFGPDDRLRTGRRPRVGCAVRFGPNADRASDGSAGGLRAGPCFLQAPSPAPEAKPY